MSRLSVCEAVAAALGLPSDAKVFPSSTGVIGWKLPVADMLEATPLAVKDLQASSVLPAAQGICTTDLYPKISSADVGSGRVVGIAKGAGMIEPNMATMLVYILTDIALPRQLLRELLQAQAHAHVAGERRRGCARGVKPHGGGAARGRW